MLRRTLALLCVAGCGGLAAPARLQAQAVFPARPIQIVMPYPPGNAIDLLARALATAMSPLLGQSAVVLNRDGAAGSVGSVSVARSAADGYTLLFAPALVEGRSIVTRPSAGELFE